MITKLFNKFDKWSIDFEERHPYIAGSICMTALLGGIYTVMIIGKYAGY